MTTAGLVPDDELPFPEDAVEVGRIVDAFGIKGWLKVQAYSSDPKALFSSRRWFLKPPEGDARRPAPVSRTGAAGSGSVAPAPLPRLLKITRADEHGDHVVAQCQEVVDRNGAEALRGVRVFVSRTSFPTPSPDEYYWVDLIGLQVVNREGIVLGTVRDLMETGPHSVMRLQTENGEGEGEERLIPFVAAVVDSVDLEQKRIVADWQPDY